MKRLLAASLILISSCKPANSPTADLASPSQETRDAAAKILRATAKPSSKIKWFFFTSHIKIGETQSNLFNLLRAYNLSTQPESGMGGLGEYWEYRLDDYWLLGCDFNNNDYTRLILEKWRLTPRWRVVAVWPSTNFSGVWINYYANGQKFTEYKYKDGSRSGECITFDPEGSKRSDWNYEHGVAEGLYSQYFPSGRIQYQAQYSNNVRGEIGIWYNEDGTTNHITKYPRP